jgi:lipooligosaccharide transport system permease protein
MMPLFLFSGTFFPITQLPVALRWVAYALPLWHGVDLSRHLYDGNLGLLTGLGNAAYLVAWSAAGLFVARRTYSRRLAR